MGKDKGEIISTGHGEKIQNIQCRITAKTSSYIHHQIKLSYKNSTPVVKDVTGDKITHGSTVVVHSFTEKYKHDKLTVG